MPYVLGSKGYSGGSGSGSYPSIPPSPYLPGFSSMFLGRHDFTTSRSPLYGGGGSLGILGFSSYGMSSYGSPYASTSNYGGYGAYTSTAGQKSYYSPLPTISEHSIPNSSAGNKRRIPRTYIPVVALPPAAINRPALYTSSGVKTIKTEDIDVTTPRKTAKPGEISRERNTEGYGTIRRGRTVIRLETKKLKENPYLPESEQNGEGKRSQKRKSDKIEAKPEPVPSSPAAVAPAAPLEVEKESDEVAVVPPVVGQGESSLAKDFSAVTKWYEDEIQKPVMKKERNAGDKFREKYMVHSRKNNHQAGYRRPTLSDIRAQKAVVLKEIEERLKKLATATENGDSGECADELKVEAEKLEKDKERLARLDKKMAKRFSKALKKAGKTNDAETSDDESIMVDRQTTMKALRKSSTGNLKLGELAQSPDTPAGASSTQGQRLTRKITKRFFFPQEASSVVQPEIFEAAEPMEPQDLFEKNILAQRQTLNKMKVAQKKVAHISQRKSSASASELEVQCDSLSDKLCDGIKEILEPTDELQEILEEEIQPKVPTIKEGKTASGRKKKYVKKVGDPPAKRIPGNILQPLVPPEGDDSPEEEPVERPSSQKRGSVNIIITPNMKIIGKVNGLITSHQASKEAIVKNMFSKPIPTKINVLTNEKQAAFIGGLPGKNSGKEQIGKSKDTSKEIKSSPQGNQKGALAMTTTLAGGAKPALMKDPLEEKKQPQTVGSPSKLSTSKKEHAPNSSELASVPPKVEQVATAASANDAINLVPDAGATKVDNIKPEMKNESNTGAVTKLSAVAQSLPDTKAAGTAPTPKKFGVGNQTANKIEEQSKSPLIAKLKPKLALDNKSASFDAVKPKLKLENKSSSLDSKDDDNDKDDKDKKSKNEASVDTQIDKSQEKIKPVQKKNALFQKFEQANLPASKQLTPPPKSPPSATKPDTQTVSSQNIVPKALQNESTTAPTKEKTPPPKLPTTDDNKVPEIKPNNITETGKLTSPPEGSKVAATVVPKKETTPVNDNKPSQETLAGVKNPDGKATESSEIKTDPVKQAAVIEKTPKPDEIPKKTTAVTETKLPVKQDLVPVKVPATVETKLVAPKDKPEAVVKPELEKVATEVAKKVAVSPLKKAEESPPTSPKDVPKVQPPNEVKVITGDKASPLSTLATKTPDSKTTSEPTTGVKTPPVETKVKEIKSSQTPPSSPKSPLAKTAEQNGKLKVGKSPESPSSAASSPVLPQKLQTPTPSTYAIKSKENKLADNKAIASSPAAKLPQPATTSPAHTLPNGHLSPPQTAKGKAPPSSQPAISTDKPQPSKSPQPSATTQKEGATTTAKVANLGGSTDVTTNGPKTKTPSADDVDLPDITAQMNKLGNLSLASENISEILCSDGKASSVDVLSTDDNKPSNNVIEKLSQAKDGGARGGGDGSGDKLPNSASEIPARKSLKRGSSESSGSSSISSSGSSGSTAKSESGSSTSSTVSAGSSAGSRRLPSPPVDDDSDDDRIALDKICPAKTRPKYRKYEIEDFQFLKVLGKGSFGKVLLAELKGSDSYFAIKCLKKDVVLEDDDVECTMIERKVLLMGSKHPYLCHLFCTFQTESHLFFVMEYLNGGDLMFHIQQSGKFAEERARFYGAEIVSGLKFLHKKGVIYRDLKLDNILLDYEGHIRIADFGMCKLQIYLDRTADTFCGTPDYMAPEIIKGLRYNQCVDWWAFGVLMYEMLIGQSPFSGHDEDELFWSVCNEPVHYPRFLSKESKRLLELLLEKDASKRLGTVGCTHGDVKEQPFFQPIDWDRLEQRDLEPPYKPKLKHSLDVQYFDTTFTKEAARLTPVDKEILRSMDQTQFDGFSYTNPHTTD